MNEVRISVQDFEAVFETMLKAGHLKKILGVDGVWRYALTEKGKNANFDEIAKMMGLKKDE